MNLECVTRAGVGITFWNNSVYKSYFATCILSSSDFSRVV